MNLFSDPPVLREPDQEDILATALILAQSYGDRFRGMTAADWVADAIHFRQKVKAAGDVFYEDDPEPTADGE